MHTHHIQRSLLAWSAATTTVFAAVWDKAQTSHGYGLALDRTNENRAVEDARLAGKGFGIETLVSYTIDGKVLYGAHYSQRPNNVKSK